MIYTLELKYEETATLKIEAESYREAYQKWLDGDYNWNEIESDEDLMGGIPWELDGIGDENRNLFKSAKELELEEE